MAIARNPFRSLSKARDRFLAELGSAKKVVYSSETNFQGPDQTYKVSLKPRAPKSLPPVAPKAPRREETKAKAGGPGKVKSRATRPQPPVKETPIITVEFRSMPVPGSERLRTAKTILDWATRHFMPGGSVAADALATFWKKAADVERLRGSVGLILFVKEGRTRLLRALSTPEAYPKGGMRRRLFPYFGRSLVPNDLRDETAVNLRILLSALSITRAWYLPPAISVTNITTPGVTPVWGDLSPEVNRFWKMLGYQPRKGNGKSTSPRWSKYHFTTKSGPNGHAL